MKFLKWTRNGVTSFMHDIVDKLVTSSEVNFLQSPIFGTPGFPTLSGTAGTGCLGFDITCMQRWTLSVYTSISLPSAEIGQKIAADIQINQKKKTISTKNINYYGR